MRKKARLTLLAFSIVLLAGCETFSGLFIPNPAEECTWLEQAAYVAMPIGFMDAPRIMASWYGTEDGHVEWISVQGGYRNGDIRVAIGAMLYGDPAGPKPPDSGWSTEIERQNYLDITNPLRKDRQIFFQYGLPSVWKYTVPFSCYRKSRRTIRGGEYIGTAYPYVFR